MRGDVSSNMVNFRLEGKPDSHHSAMLGGTIAAGIEWTQRQPRGNLDLGATSWLVCRAGGQHMALRRTVWVSVFPLLAVVAACVPQDGAPKAANVVSPAPAQQSIAAAARPASAPPAPATKITTDLTAPRSTVGTATYGCGNGSTITIQNLGSSLRVIEPNGATEEFAASPANQSSRYQEAATHNAIVIDGREALVMKRGSTPQTCRR